MPQLHLLRVGAMGHVGRFASIDAVRYPRGARVVLRTARGLETGEVLSPNPDEGPYRLADGSILRGMTVEDDLLQARLTRRRKKALSACSARLAELGLPVTLLDAEALFDGRTLVFYFLGESTPELDALVAELTEIYDAQVQFRRFAAAVTAGCGPGCGTENATGGGCQSCATGCALAGACTSHQHAAT